MSSDNILFIVYKATSELDYILPLAWKIKKEKPDSNISVLYAAINKKQILRGADYYSLFLEENNVPEYDLSDFLFGSIPFIQKFFKEIYKFSYFDTTSSKIPYVLKLAIRKTIKILEGLFLTLFNFEKMLSKLDPKIAFFCRRDYRFPGKEKFYKYFDKYKTKVILYPHGAFTGRGLLKFDYGRVAKNNKDIPIPEFYEVWHSFADETVPQFDPPIDNQFHDLGYPGLDSEWFWHLKDRYLQAPDKNKDNIENSELRCLFIIRKFVKNNNDPWVFETEEFSEILNNLVQSLKLASDNIKLVIKPHPSNDYTSTAELLEKAGCPNWEITYEPIYLAVTKCDFVVSISSTVMLVPSLYGLPVIFLNSSVKKTFDTWSPIKKMYSGLQFYVEKPKELSGTIKKVVSSLLNGENLQELIEKDVKHFRRFFPDSSLEMSMERLGSI